MYELQDTDICSRLANHIRIEIIRSKVIGIEILKSKSIKRIKCDALTGQLAPQASADIATMKVMTTTRSRRIAKKIIQIKVIIVNYKSNESMLHV